MPLYINYNWPARFFDLNPSNSKQPQILIAKYLLLVGLKYLPKCKINEYLSNKKVTINTNYMTKFYYFLLKENGTHLSCIINCLIATSSGGNKNY